MSPRLRSSFKSDAPRSLLALGLVAGVVGAFGQTPAPTGDRSHDYTLARIREAHRSRVGRIDTMTIMWHTTKIRRRAAADPPDASATPPDVHNDPHGEIVERSSIALTFKGGMIRSEGVMDSWRPSHGLLQDLPFVSVHRDYSSAIFHRDRNEGIVFHQTDPILAPLMQDSFSSVAYDATFNRTPGFLFAANRDVLRVDSVDSMETVVVGVTDYDSGPVRGMTREEYFLDPAREFVLVRRLSMYPDGQVGFDRRIEYARDDEGRFFPTRSTNVFFRGTENPAIEEETVIAGVAFNRPVDDSIFDLEFPAGARIYDQRTQRVSTANAPASANAREVLDSVEMEEGAEGGVEELQGSAPAPLARGSAIPRAEANPEPIAASTESAAIEASSPRGRRLFPFVILALLGMGAWVCWRRRS